MSQQQPTADNAISVFATAADPIAGVALTNTRGEAVASDVACMREPGATDDVSPALDVETAPSSAGFREEDATAAVWLKQRLGVAAGLFAALKVRHAPTARHALRVAMICSAWADRRTMPDAERIRLEAGALLHDVGMIGLPDQILLKPGPLTAEEAFYVDRARHMTLDIMSRITSDSELLTAMDHVPAWYDGSRPGYSLRGRSIPLIARMIAVAEAYDAMTTAHLYRSAMSVERAVAELYHYAGTQFDPDLVTEFAVHDWAAFLGAIGGGNANWLKAVDPNLADSLWDAPAAAPAMVPPEMETVFQHRLLSHMHDGVAFFDAQRKILQWNHGMERLTGIAADGIRYRLWSPGIVALRNERGNLIDEETCPVVTAIRYGMQNLRRLTIRGRNGTPIPVDCHVVPVVLQGGAIIGAVMVMHDASPEINLEQRVETLKERVNKDPMTQLANRAEFDRMLAFFVEQYRRNRGPFSLILSDLDRFKQINDVHGHQAGDDAIRSFASILNSQCRAGDLVARYGGEEFAVICAGCDVATGARRAEQLRRLLAATLQPRLGGRPVTASFGVTEIQPGDTAETVLRRADRALLEAKAKGRNTVVQLGSGNNGETGRRKSSFWPWRRESVQLAVSRVFHTDVPPNVALEKLRGFIADHQGRVTRVERNRMDIEIEDRRPRQERRRSDRPACFALEVILEEERPREARQGTVRTRLQVHATLARYRDRRRRDLAERLHDLLESFRSYMMVTEEEASTRPNILTRAVSLAAHWLQRR
ncbi:MAG: diguanylate cyclase [Thermogutta sp.]